MTEQLTQAAGRLERALSALEARARDLKVNAGASDDDLFASRPGAHDNELRAAAQEASQALNAAAAALRDAIGAED